MKLKKIAILVIMLLLVLVCSQAGATEDGGISAETRERISDQYGLESPSSVLPYWAGADIGTSSPVDLMLLIIRFIVSPLTVMIQELL
ncbi:hypothetical protein [Paenibacillus sp. MMS20-IR301]|uniref:hypothetical protein n=1 Tax=Paenibacillus sp. MMS20-IR301 TaxID=2895946 RepID=UPI0028EF6907|nr:hypothetical protein [Paenibacillus sp. MMS20-IR301]WNS44973.1 hypothetical protein LOS79_06795 [Paenibacillus sp. MMS20-IR301]